LFKHHEFWSPRVFEIPYYFYLGWQCLRHGISIKTLAKANYCLDHGEIGIGSKYVTQLAFDQSHFLPTALVNASLSDSEKQQQIEGFAKQYGYPVILKSDVGCVGKGIRKVDNIAELVEATPLLLGDYIVQQFTPFKFECGIFYVRQQGQGRITGVNQKHFPYVVGNGVDSLAVLARQHERYNHHWQSFLQYLETDKIPAEGEKVNLSFIGSHTLGCKFTSDDHLLTPALEKAVLDFFDKQPGYNFGRVDVKAENEEALKRGKFVIIEVNGVASLPTHMFDPSFSLLEAYKVFLQHAKYLAAIAKEHKNQTMDLLSYREVIQRVKTNQALLNQAHIQLKE